MSKYVRQVMQPVKPLASRLGQLDIELTERCNNDCIHCYINRPANDAAARAREMTTEEVKDILRQAVDLGSLQVRLTGGEPLLRPDFEELYVFARHLGLKVVLFTNARLITPRLADLLVHLPPLLVIEVTVYGMHRESYEAVTREPGSFAQFRRGLNLLRENDVPFVVKSALLPPNRHEIDEFEAWARTIPWMSEIPRYCGFLDLRARRDDAGKNRLIETLRMSPQDGLAVLTRDAANFRKGKAKFRVEILGTGRRPTIRLRRRVRHLRGCIWARPTLYGGPHPGVDLRGRRGEWPFVPARRPGPVLLPPRTTRHQPRLPAALCRLFPQKLMRAVPGQVMGGAWYARYPGRVSVRRDARASTFPWLVGRKRVRMGGAGLAGANKIVIRNRVPSGSLQYGRPTGKSFIAMLPNFQSPPPRPLSV